MKIITRHTQASGAAKRWANQYKHDDIMRETTLRRLKALGRNPDPDDVDKVIGNGSWTTTPHCDECGVENVPVVCVGEEPDYDSSTACLCSGCVVDAFTLLVGPLEGC